MSNLAFQKSLPRSSLRSPMRPGACLSSLGRTDFTLADPTASQVIAEGAALRAGAEGSGNVAICHQKREAASGAASNSSASKGGVSSPPSPGPCAARRRARASITGAGAGAKDGAGCQPGGGGGGGAAVTPGGKPQGGGPAGLPAVCQSATSARLREATGSSLLAASAVHIGAGNAPSTTSTVRTGSSSGGRRRGSRRNGLARPGTNSGKGSAVKRDGASRQSPGAPAAAHRGRWRRMRFAGLRRVRLQRRAAFRPLLPRPCQHPPG